MSLKTRLDGRSKKNNTLYIKDSKGNVVGTLVLLDSHSSNIEVTTSKDYHIEKNNGWSSINHKGA